MGYRTMVCSVLFRSLALLLFSPVLLAHLYAQEDERNFRAETTPESLIEEGRKLYFRHQYPQAIERYTEALKKAPQNITALYELAWAYFEIGEHTQSLEAATEASLYASDHIDGIYALISLNYYYTMTVATYEIELNERSEEDVANFRKAARTAEDGDERLFKLALTYIARGNLQAGETAYIEALQVRPDYSEAHWEVGKCFERQKKFSLAAMAYSHAILNAPDGVFAPRILTMIENCLARAAGDSQTVHTTPQETPAALIGKLKEIATKPDAQSRADTLAWNYYLPWFREMLKNHDQEALANYLYQAAHNREADKWIAENPENLSRFLTWSRAFHWAGTVERATLEK